MGYSPAVHPLAWTDTQGCPDPGAALKVHKGPPLQLVQVHVDGIPSLGDVNHTTAAWCHLQNC